MTRRALIIAPYFPPRRRVGSLRPFRFASHLESAGWEPIVTFLDTPGAELTSREQELLRGVHLLPLRAPFDTTQRLASGGLTAGSRTTSPKPSAIKRLGLSLRNRVDSAIPLDSWAPVLWLHSKSLPRRLRRLAPSVVMSTADPWSSHWLGMELSRKLQVPWVADFRDPWTLCPIRSQVPEWTLQMNRNFEAKVVATASALCFTAEGTRENYARHFPEHASKMHCIRNGFDSRLLADPVAVPSPVASPNAELNIVFFGRFRPLSPATAIIEALQRIKDARAEPAIRVHAVGGLSGSDLEFAIRAGVADCFVPLTPRPYEHSLSMIRQYDLALVSTAYERDDIVPAKLWEYLAAGIPILSLTRNPELAAVLEATQAGVQIEPQKSEEVALLLTRCRHARATGQPLPLPRRQPQNPLTEFDAPALTAQLARIFDELTRV